MKFRSRFCGISSDTKTLSDLLMPSFVGRPGDAVQPEAALYQFSFCLNHISDRPPISGSWICVKKLSGGHN